MEQGEAGVYCIYKNLGETPLEALERFRSTHPEFAHESITYAGRLDPLAEGLLIILVGEACRRKEEFLGLDKEYMFEVLWGFETDSYDLLGKACKGGLPEFSEEELKKVALAQTGKIRQLYPPYSSKPVHGKPLFQWAREGKLSEIEIPAKEVEVHELSFVNTRTIPKLELIQEILKRIALVAGDFRQGEAIQSWNDVFSSATSPEFLVTSMKAKASSGTYVRSIAHELGKALGCGAVAFSIKRQSVGKLSYD